MYKGTWAGGDGQSEFGRPLPPWRSPIYGARWPRGTRWLRLGLFRARPPMEPIRLPSTMRIPRGRTASAPWPASWSAVLHQQTQVCLSRCGAASTAAKEGVRGVLNGKKKSVPVPIFPKKPAGTPCAQPWLVAVGGWRLAAVGGWQLATGGWWRLVVVGGGWWLAVGGWRRLAVVGSWRLAVGGPLGRSLRALLSKKKKISSVKDPPGG